MKNTKIKKIFSISVLVIVLLFFVSIPFVLSAQTYNTPPSSTLVNVPKIQNPFNGGDDLMSLLQTILKDIIMPIAAVVSVVYIIWAGFQYVTAQGKPAEIQKANANLLWALIGVGVLLGATGISMVIQITVNSLIK